VIIGSSVLGPLAPNRRHLRLEINGDKDAERLLAAFLPSSGPSSTAVPTAVDKRKLRAAPKRATMAAGSDEDENDWTMRVFFWTGMAKGPVIIFFPKVDGAEGHRNHDPRASMRDALTVGSSTYSAWKAPPFDCDERRGEIPPPRVCAPIRHSF
jgi:hypothetical protein